MIIRFLSTKNRVAFDVESKAEYMAAVQAAAADAKPASQALVCTIKLPETMGGWAPVTGLHVPLGYWGAKARLSADWGYLRWYESLIAEIEVALLEQVPKMVETVRSAQIVTLKTIS